MAQNPRATSSRALAVLALAALAAFVGRAWLRDQRRAAEESVHAFERVAAEPAPEMLLLSADGARRRLSDSQGKPVLVHFWASWCPPCRRELPALLSLAGRLAGEIELVAITVDDDWAPVRSLFGGQIPAEIAMDASDTASATWQLELLPETYLLAADGTRRLRFVGPRDWSDASAADVLRAALTAGALGATNGLAPEGGR